MPKSKQVDDWFARYDNPMKDVVLRVREIILRADPRIEECIKWQAPTFSFRGNLASFFPKSKQHASLMFHLGAKIPGKHPRLEGSGNTSRVVKLASIAEANAAERDLAHVVRAWCQWREASSASKPATPKRKADSTAARKKSAPNARRKGIRNPSKARG